MRGGEGEGTWGRWENRAWGGDRRTGHWGRCESWTCAEMEEKDQQGDGRTEPGGRWEVSGSLVDDAATDDDETSRNDTKSRCKEEIPFQE